MIVLVGLRVPDLPGFLMGNFTGVVPGSDSDSALVSPQIASFFEAARVESALQQSWLSQDYCTGISKPI
jgi:hypothetical protein